MNKIIRLKESDIHQIVKKVLKEDEEIDDAYWAQAKEDLTCKDCREFNPHDPDMYMVNDEIWDEYGNEEDMLCPGCLEKRMGRKLKKGDVSDYADAEVNLENPYIQSLTEEFNRLLESHTDKKTNHNYIIDPDKSATDNEDICDELTVNTEKEIRNKMRGMKISKKEKKEINKIINKMNKIDGELDVDLDVNNTYLRHIQNILCTYSQEDKENID